MIGELPRRLDVNGKNYAIRTDFREILKILYAFSDPDFKDEEKVYICLVILYEDFDSICPDDYEAAFQAAIRFIDQGMSENEDDRGRTPHIMDWEQDESIMFPAINKVAGFETRSVDYLHWWTFLGYYMEITEGVYSHVLNIRLKRAKGQKLEKWEREFWSANKGICVLKKKLSEEEKAERAKINALLG